LLPLLRTFDAQIWSYDAPGKAKMLSSFHIQRYFAWQAWVEGFKGIGHWVYAHHNPATTRWMADMREGVGAFFAVVYEGRGPVPSKRWESMREGIEDWMLLDMLRKEIDAAKARGVSADRLKSAEWQVTEMPRQMMKRLRDAGRYVHRMVSDTAFDEVTVELDAAKRAVVKEIVRVRALK